MNIPIWPGSSSFTPGKTPFGYYDFDLEFQINADKVADWCAKRIGVLKDWDTLLWRLNYKI